MNRDFIMFIDFFCDKTIRINVDNIMCYYPSHYDKNFEEEEYITIELIGNKNLSTIHVKGLSKNLDSYFRIHKFDTYSFIENDRLPADINNIP